MDNAIIDKDYQDELDIKSLFRTLLERKNLVLITTFSGFFIACLISLIPKRTWQGEFQIVISSKSDSDITSSLNPALVRLGGLSSVNKDLMTEIEILKSPSVLMDIFEFVKENKLSQNKSYEKFKFKSWQEQFKIGLERGTTVLNLSYRDNEKDLILPVLQKISDTYQLYSNNAKQKIIKSSKAYFKDQISYFEQKSDQSIKEFWTYGIEKGLSTNLINQSINTSRLGINSNNPIIESPRIKSINTIRYLKEQLNKMESLPNGSNKIIYTAYTIPSSQASSKTIKEINEIDKKLANFRYSYKESDEIIQNSLIQKTILLDLLKKQVMDYLGSEIQKEEINLKAFDRPKEVLLKYDTLKRVAQKDKLTLNNLENEYRRVLLEEAKSQEPWKLITKPTLLPYPVAPERKKIGFLGLIIGGFVGSTYAFIKEKQEGKLNTVEEFEKILNLPILSEISLKPDFNPKEKYDLLSQILLNDNFAFLEIGDFKNIKKVKAYSNLTKFLKDDNKNILTTKVSEALKYTNIIFMISLGVTTKNDLINVRKELFLHNKNIKGAILIKDIN